MSKTVNGNEVYLGHTLSKITEGGYRIDFPNGDSQPFPNLTSRAKARAYVKSLQAEGSKALVETPLNGLKPQVVAFFLCGGIAYAQVLKEFDEDDTLEVKILVAKRSPSFVGDTLEILKNETLTDEQINGHRQVQLFARRDRKTKRNARKAFFAPRYGRKAVTT